ncbi:MAG TPA: nucleotidyltransferase family protein [Ktedonobacterales bacterium]|nr:nucleotidyltransferase family protein [Ktedonobacterales bacterium]
MARGGRGGMRVAAGGCWPSPLQEELLRAALLPGEAAVKAWEHWSAAVDLDELGLDLGSYRLLPLLYRNLSACGVTGGPLERLKGIYRLTWSKNHLLLRRIAPVLRALREAGIQPLVLKGAALAALAYRDVGARPMDDVDLLVRDQELPAALDVLREAGWHPVLDDPPEQRLVHQHSLAFIDNGGHADIDLHAHALWYTCWPGADDGFFAAAIPLALGEEPVLALCPADQLLHVCTHGIVWNPLPPIRWVADAMAVIRGAEETLDWERLSRQVERLGLALPVREALRYLAERFEAPIPAGVLTRLEALPVTRLARLEYWLKLRPKTLPRAYVLAWFRYTRRTGPPRWGRWLRDLPSFLQSYWRLSSPRQVPGHALAKLMRRVARVRGAVSRGRVLY